MAPKRRRIFTAIVLLCGLTFLIWVLHDRKLVRWVETRRLMELGFSDAGSPTDSRGLALCDELYSSLSAADRQWIVETSKGFYNEVIYTDLDFTGNADHFLCVEVRLNTPVLAWVETDFHDAAHPYHLTSLLIYLPGKWIRFRVGSVVRGFALQG